MRLFVVEPDGGGGMIHYAYQLCTALAAEGADVTLVTSRHYELADLPHTFRVDPRMRLWRNVDPDAVERGGALGAVYSLGRALRRVVRGIRYSWEWERLTRHLIRRRPDVVQLGVIRFRFLAFFLHRMRRAGLTLTQVCHEFEERDLRGGRIATASAYRAFSAVFLHGEANRAAFLSRFGYPPERTTVIPHGNEAMFAGMLDSGSDARRRYGIAPDRPVALFFGGLRPSKGLPDLVEAFALVRRDLDAALIVAGAPQGVDGSSVRSWAQDAGVGDDVVVDARYLPLDEVGSVIRAADVVVLPYRSASASGALQVAYAFARPVIATAAGDLPSAVDEGRTGFVVPPRDPQALAAAMLKMLGDRAEAAAMGAEARRIAEERYSWAPIARAVLDASRAAAGEE